MWRLIRVATVSKQILLSNLYTPSPLTLYLEKKLVQFLRIGTFIRFEWVNVLCVFNFVIIRRMAENGFAPPLGNFADISYLVEN